MPIRCLHHLRAFFVLAIVGLGSLALATTASARITTPTLTARDHTSAKPTIVLVHGAFARFQ